MRIHIRNRPIDKQSGLKEDEVEVQEKTVGGSFCSSV